jgi:hypothetical protein
VPDTPAHEVRESLAVDVEYPEHVQRTCSAEFAANRHRLLNKLDLPCWKCGSKEKREVHHFVVEYSEWQSADPAKVRAVFHKFDPYGFAADWARQGDALPTSPDVLPNLLVLCETCHRGAYMGIHQVPLPFWFADMVKKDGAVVLKAPGGA